MRGSLGKSKGRTIQSPWLSEETRSMVSRSQTRCRSQRVLHIREGPPAYRSDLDTNTHLRFDLFRQIVLKANLFDRFHLCFDPIDMLIYVFGHILKHMPGGEVGHLRAMDHAFA